MAALPNFPPIRPSLLLDFANSGRVDPRISFTRASTDLAPGPNGAVRVIPQGVPTIEYELETGRALGFFVGRTRTNLMTYSEQMWDTAYWTVGSALAGGAFASAVQSTEVLDIYGKNGPSTKITILSQAGLFARKPVSVPIGVNAVSVFIYVPPQAGINNYALACDAEDVERGSTATSAVFGQWVRHRIPITTAAARAYIDFNMVTNGVPAVAGFTFYIMGAQLCSPGGDPPYIFTFGGQATRAGDLVVLDSSALAPAFNPNEWTLVFSSEKSPLELGQWPRYISLNSGSAADEFMVVDQAGAGISVGAQAAGVFQGEVAIPVSGTFTLALSYRNKQMRMSINGGAIVTHSMAAAPGVTQMSIGGPSWSAKIEAAIARLSLYPKQLTDLQLQALSA